MVISSRNRESHPTNAELKAEIYDGTRIIDTFLRIGGVQVEMLPYMYGSGERMLPDHTVGHARQQLETTMMVEKISQQMRVEAETEENRSSLDQSIREQLEYGHRLTHQIIDTITTAYIPIQL